MKRYILIIAIVLFAAACLTEPNATAVPAPLPTPTPSYEMWQPGQSGYFLCVNGWNTELTGQSVHPVCKTGNVKTAPTPEPGHFLWQPGQHGYLLCENDWFYEEWGQSMYLACPEGETTDEK